MTFGSVRIESEGLTCGYRCCLLGSVALELRCQTELHDTVFGYDCGCAGADACGCRGSLAEAVRDISDASQYRILYYFKCRRLSHSGPILARCICV